MKPIYLAARFTIICMGSNIRFMNSMIHCAELPFRQTGEPITEACVRASIRTG
jgi:hypothetical protein